MVHNYDYASWGDPEHSSDYGLPPVDLSKVERYTPTPIPGHWCKECLRHGLNNWVSNVKNPCEECSKRKRERKKG